MNNKIEKFDTVKDASEMDKYLTGWIVPVSMQNPQICQGYGGEISNHKTRYADHTYSLNFIAPWDTEVKASKAGIVKLIFKDGDAYYEGLDPEGARGYQGNQIILDHGNGVYSRYEHLSDKSFSEFGIEKGKKVEKGQIIARVGKSGWVGPIPNLWFNSFVYERNMYSDIDILKTLPIIFEDFQGSLWDDNLPAKDKFNNYITQSRS